jgi:hypothetical protein
MLSGFLFDLDQSNIYRFTRQNIEYSKKMHTNFKDMQNNKKIENSEVENISRFFGFHRLYRTTNSKAHEQRRKMYYSGKKKRHTVKNQIMINNHGYYPSQNRP